MAIESPTGAVIHCAGRVLDLRQPKVMGVLNVTPDSFSDGGELLKDAQLDVDALCRRAEGMVAAGAAVLDIGGESTRPGADVVSESEECDRVLSALAVLVERFDVVISLDTSTPVIMTEGARLGAGMINDVRALTREGALAAAAQAALPVCLMHMQGEPQTMQSSPCYENVAADVAAFLRERQGAAVAAGILPSQILFDPGFGFGKTLAHNFELLRRIPEICAIGPPVLAGLSRKSMIAKVIPRESLDRLSGSLALAVMAAMGGARLLRVHDVQETVDALAMVTALETITS